MTQPELRVGGRGPKGRLVKPCAKCGTPFETSSTGSTVNCPNCRGRSNTASAVQSARGGPKRMAAKPRDMRGHLYEYHSYSPNQLNEAESGGGLESLHGTAHEENRFSWLGGEGEHTHGDIFRDRR